LRKCLVFQHLWHLHHHLSFNRNVQPVHISATQHDILNWLISGGVGTWKSVCQQSTNIVGKVQTPFTDNLHNQVQALTKKIYIFSSFHVPTWYFPELYWSDHWVFWGRILT
jgi:hypothetical protein